MAINEQWGPPQPFTVHYGQIKTEDILGRVIRCPDYNTNTLSIYNWCSHPTISQARKPYFMEALRESIKSDGFRNPIVVYALPEGIYLSFGGSRALAAREMGIEFIPAIINAYAEGYDQLEQVTEENFASFFTDIPVYFEITEYGAETHYSMERNRRHTYDPAGIAWAEGREDNTFISREFSWLPKYKTEK